jgi:hypothetical protein
MSAIPIANALVSVKNGTDYIEHCEIEARSIAIAMVFARQLLDNHRVASPTAEVEVEFEDEVIFDSAQYIPITQAKNCHEGAYIGVVCGIVFDRVNNFIDDAKNVNKEIGFDDTNYNRLLMAIFIADHVSAFEYQPSASRIAKFMWWKMDELNLK